MPHLIAVALIGAGMLAGLRIVLKLAESLQAGAEAANPGRQADASVRGIEAKDLGALEFDSVSGVYKPAKGRP